MFSTEPRGVASSSTAFSVVMAEFRLTGGGGGGGVVLPPREELLSKRGVTP